jgi:hypothetical protein
MKHDWAYALSEMAPLPTLRALLSLSRPKIDLIILQSCSLTSRPWIPVIFRSNGEVAVVAKDGTRNHEVFRMEDAREICPTSEETDVVRMAHRGRIYARPPAWSCGEVEVMREPILADPPWCRLRPGCWGRVPAVAGMEWLAACRRAPSVPQSPAPRQTCFLARISAGPLFRQRGISFDSSSISTGNRIPVPFLAS